MKKSEALKILGLADGASDDEVKKAHRKLVVAHHPDNFPLNSSERADAEELTKQINEARDVLLNRSWTPEFDPRRDPRPYAGNPYAHPSSSSGAGSAAGASGSNPYDPFEGWPFGTAGQTTYVWTSWDDIFTNAARGSASQGATGQGASRQSTSSAGFGGAGQDAGWPFGGFTVEYDPLDPFAAFRVNYTATKTPEEAFAEAKHDLRLEVGVFAGKVLAFAALAAFGSVATGLFVYVMASIIFGLYKRLGNFFALLLVPIALIGAPFVFMLAPREGFVSGPLMIAFFIAVLFDFTNIRDRYRMYAAAKSQL